MNRQTLVDATIDAQGNVVLGESGHQIVYDTNGNRLSDTHAGNRLVSSTSGNTPLFYWHTGGDNGGGYMLSAAGVPMQDGDPVYGYANDGHHHQPDLEHRMGSHLLKPIRARPVSSSAFGRTYFLIT